MAAVLRVLALACLLATASAGACDGYKSCGSCNQDLRCGWCGATKKCMEGDKEGKACPKQWQYGVCEEQDECSSFTTCDACTGQSFCGWCSSAGKCLSGHNTGPSSDVCTFWDYNVCRNRKLPATKAVKVNTKTFGWRGSYGERLCRTSDDELESTEATVELSDKILSAVRINGQNQTESKRVNFLRSGKRRPTRTPCEKLLWAEPASTQFLCASAKDAAGKCPAVTDYVVSRSICTSQGARVCNSTEARASFGTFVSQCPTNGTAAELWTSTKCKVGSEDGFMVLTRAEVVLPVAAAANGSVGNATGNASAFLELGAEKTWNYTSTCRVIDAEATPMCCSDSEPRIEPQSALDNFDVATLMRINVTRMGAEDLKGKLNIESELESATLSIYMMQKQVDVSLHMLRQTFDMDNVTFKTRPPYNPSSVSSGRKNTTTGENVGWMDFDVTSYIAKVLAPPQYNEGLYVRSNVENGAFQLTNKPLKLSLKWKQQRLDPLCPKNGKKETAGERGALKHNINPF